MNVNPSLELALKKMIFKQCRVKGIKPEEVPATDPVIGSLGLVQLDSLDAVEIVTALEKSMGLKAEGATLKNIFKSYNELNLYITQNVAEEKINQFISENS